MPEHVSFISDLHLMCERSVAGQHVSDFHGAARRSQHFVLGGDIFDFKWSRLKTVERTIKAARKWLEDFIHPHPHCQFHYLLGNHDCSPLFVDQLEQLAGASENFRWYPYYLRMDSVFFLHGDVLDGTPRQEHLVASREGWLHESPRGALANFAYNGLVAARVHRVVARARNPATKVTSRLLSYIDHVGHGATSGLTDVFFGHTHRQMLGHDYQGIKFHNGGAPIKGLPFKMLETKIGGVV